ncbi:methyltransferase-like protein 25B [Anthonomus grandis grandis]|uniref:methyltransferase-like protein 25B n=1 Tax=Anthonomus grandis grandis TaxID=2921223 RepID=UPI002165363A|nr:methyltransferase-like protein 25B [Anthonomus grandis grandis]
MQNYQNLASTCYKVVELYQEVLTSYVLDFYVEDHWYSKLPNSWREFLQNISIQQMDDLLNCYNACNSRTLPPLSILCIQEIVRGFSVNRKQIVPREKLLKNEQNFMKHFQKKVKLKKIHEIEIMSKICNETSLQTGCRNVVDIGSGLGHLSRMLSFRYGLNVCTIEANQDLVRLAPKYDEQFEKLLSVKNISHECKITPRHICKRIEDNITCQDFETLVKNTFSTVDENFEFGIVGLHPCGNLGSTLLRLFNESKCIKFINIASCCYMKLTLNSNEAAGYPLSNYFDSKQYHLDYLCCETACHAIEQYISKIRSDEYMSLKIHSFRAALECLIHKYDRTLAHCAVGNVKHKEGMTFEEYCRKATERYNFQFLSEDLNHFSYLIERTWQNVVKFYSCRLLLAPLAESVILYDRFLYLKEGNNTCDLIPAFDSSISPRCHVIKAIKR